MLKKVWDWFLQNSWFRAVIVIVCSLPAALDSAHKWNKLGIGLVVLGAVMLVSDLISRVRRERREEEKAKDTERHYTMPTSL